MIDILNILNTAIVATVGWFNDLFFASGVIDVYLSCIFIFVLIRFLVVPVFGRSRGSDRSRKKVADDNE